MAVEMWTVQELELLVEDGISAFKRIGDVCNKMRRAEVSEIALQARTAMTIYRQTLVRLSGTIESEFQDQLNCKKTGMTPAWQMNQRKVEAARNRKAAAAKDKEVRRKDIKPREEEERK